MICLLVVHNCINPRNVMTNIPNRMRFLSTIDMGYTTLMLQTIPLMMILATYQTLQLCSTIASSLLLSISLLNCIELVLGDYIFFLTYILRYSSLWCPFSFRFLISFLVTLVLNFALQLLITMFQLSMASFNNLGSSKSIWSFYATDSPLITL